jgi:hypothetical protein
MSERLHVASRKGLFTLERDPRWHVARVDFLGDNCSAVLSDARDGGRSFERLSDGLPQEHAYDICFRHAMDVDESGERLALGSTTGSLWISENGGERWDCVSTHLPPIYALRFAH